MFVCNAHLCHMLTYISAESQLSFRRDRMHRSIQTRWFLTPVPLACAREWTKIAALFRNRRSRRLCHESMLRQRCLPYAALRHVPELWITTITHELERSAPLLLLLDFLMFELTLCGTPQNRTFIIGAHRHRESQDSRCNSGGQHDQHE